MSAQPKKGDWTCASCKFSNFASRTKCRNCGKTNEWTCQTCHTTNWTGRNTCRRCVPDKEDVAVEQKKDGDWYCRVCNKLNFASRSACFACKTDKPREKKEGQEDVNLCPICYDERIDRVISTCGHSFCRNCISKQTKCPKCRGVFEERHLVRVFLDD